MKECYVVTSNTKKVKKIMLKTGVKYSIPMHNTLGFATSLRQRGQGRSIQESLNQVDFSLI